MSQSTAVQAAPLQFGIVPKGVTVEVKDKAGQAHQNGAALRAGAFAAPQNDLNEIVGAGDRRTQHQQQISASGYSTFVP